LNCTVLGIMPVEIPSAEPKTESAASGNSALSLPPDHGGPAATGKDPASPAFHPLPEGSPISRLPMQLDVTIPVPSFRVQDLLALEKGAVVETAWQPGEDVPVWCGGSQLVWSEFEVIDQKLAVRVTRLG